MRGPSGLRKFKFKFKKKPEGTHSFLVCNGLIKMHFSYHICNFT